MVRLNLRILPANPPIPNPKAGPAKDATAAIPAVVAAATPAPVYQDSI